MLAPFAERVRVVEEDIQSDADRLVDLTLYDTFGSGQGDRARIDRELADPASGTLVVYTWEPQAELVRAAIDRGCGGYLDKTLPAADLVEALERIAAGVIVSWTAAETALGSEPPEPEAAWPGQREGLSLREAEVISLITQGFTNWEIATRSYISMNSLKSYIRSAYRKMGVERRSQAVRWGIEHGMLPPMRLDDE